MYSNACMKSFCNRKFPGKVPLPVKTSTIFAEFPRVVYQCRLHMTMVKLAGHKVSTEVD